MSLLGALLLRRLSLGLLTLLCVSWVIFASIELLPGDAAQALLGQSATVETTTALRLELGLDAPLWQRYLRWLIGLMQGDFGASFANHMPVKELISARIGNTFFLAVYAAFMAVPLAILLGLLAALWRGSWFDRSLSVFNLFSISLPEFLIGYLLILVFAVRLSWFPSLSFVDDATPLWDRLYVCFLPALTLTIAINAHIMRMTRATIVALLASPYIETAHLKGLRPIRVILRHALPNALAPIATVIAFNLAYLITGVVVVEVVFTYPGMGQLLVDSVVNRDIALVQACCLIFATIYIVCNMLADVVTIATNPRLLHPRTGN